MERNVQECARSLATPGMAQGAAAAGIHYSLRKDYRAWSLIYRGQRATLKDARGLELVHYLLYHPNHEPIHALELLARTPRGSRVAGSAIVDSADARRSREPDDVQMNGGSFSISRDDLEASRRHYKERQKLEAVLDSEAATEVEKRDAQSQLDQIDAFLSTSQKRLRSNDEKAVRAVRKAIRRLVEDLLAAEGADGSPLTIVRAFGKHIDTHILYPSGRYSSRSRSIARRPLAGRFVYEAPEDVLWAS
jgi:hypothetical protein